MVRGFLLALREQHAHKSASLPTALPVVCVAVNLFVNKRLLLMGLDILAPDTLAALDCWPLADCISPVAVFSVDNWLSFGIFVLSILDFVAALKVVVVHIGALMVLHYQMDFLMVVAHSWLANTFSLKCHHSWHGIVLGPAIVVYAKH